MYAGLAPYEALALYCVITYMDSVDGVFFPEGGMHAVRTALAAAAAKAGVEFRYDAPVERILLAHGTSGAVRGVRLAGGETARAPTPWCATPTCRSPTARCCPGLIAAAAARSGRYSPSACVWHVGVAGQLPAGDRPPQHPLRPATGTARSAPCCATARACPTRRSW